MLCSLLGISNGVPFSSAPSLSNSGVLLFAEKDKWLWRECTFVRIFIVLLCVYREPAGKVEEFMELFFQEETCQVVAPRSVSGPRGKGRGAQAGTSLIPSSEVISDLGGFRGREKGTDPSSLQIGLEGTSSPLQASSNISTLISKQTEEGKESWEAPGYISCSTASPRQRGSP